jgi:hypothetical protein
VCADSCEVTRLHDGAGRLALNLGINMALLEAGTSSHTIVSVTNLADYPKRAPSEVWRHSRLLHKPNGNANAGAA